MAALFYSPVDFTDASDLHQTVVKFIGWSIESDKITLLKIKFNQENCQQKDTPLILKQMSRRMIDSPRCCFIPFIGWKFDASMHTSVRCIGEINRWIKQRSNCYTVLAESTSVHIITVYNCHGWQSAQFCLPTVKVFLIHTTLTLLRHCNKWQIS